MVSETVSGLLYVRAFNPWSKGSWSFSIPMHSSTYLLGPVAVMLHPPAYRSGDSLGLRV